MGEFGRGSVRAGYSERSEAKTAEKVVVRARLSRHDELFPRSLANIVNLVLRGDGSVLLGVRHVSQGTKSKFFEIDIHIL